MNIEPIIDARFKRYRDSYELNHLDDGVAFERFVNHAILSSHQPDAFAADAELMDNICVGGHDDMGIDGIAIKLNGLLVRNTDDIDDIIEKFQRATVEFIFIQSKYSAKFELSDFMKFTAGVKDFLSEVHYQPRNRHVEEALHIKDHLLSDDVVVLWEDNPTIRLYYVALGRWRDSPHLLAHSQQTKSDLSSLSTYGDCHVHFIDAQALKTICDNNENTFSATIEAIETMPLTPSPGVDNSCIALCYASEFLKLLTTEEGVIRKSLFDDNVRDYQGLNSVNEEMRETITTEPEKFGLLNNGITIVCDSYVPSNRRITIKNPRIVNGCQTSHVLFSASERGTKIGAVPVQLKLVSSNDLEIINQVVRGTNRQNIVHDEAFETTKIFHRELEQFFDAVATRYERIYYERRSKQFQHNPRIRQTDKVNLRILTQFMVGMFLEEPDKSHRHEARLLKMFESKLYMERHSKLPYFTASLMALRIERLFRHELIDKRRYYSFRAHLAMVFKLLVGGIAPTMNREKAIDDYCEVILTVLVDEQETRGLLEKAILSFDAARDHWITEMSRSPDGMKDIPDFTNLLARTALGTEEFVPASPSAEDRYVGRVVKVFLDRNNTHAGFIRTAERDLFFHSRENPILSFEALEGTDVYYAVGRNRKGWPMGTRVERV